MKNINHPSSGGTFAIATPGHTTSHQWIEAKPGTSRTESAELRELRRRTRLLEQENEVLRRAAAYLSQANLPGKGTTRS